MTFQTILMYVCLGALTILAPILLVLSLYTAGLLPVGELLARFRRLPPLAKIVVAVVTTQLVLYGGTKSLSGGGSGGGGWNPQPMFLSLPGEEAAAARSFTDDQLAVLAAIVSCRTNETWTFAAPEGAHVVERWRLRGAAHERVELGCAHPEDGAIALDTYGHIRTGARVYSPLERQLGLVPEARWEALGRESLAWWQTTAGNSTVVTWQNVLLDRDADTPVSVQAEFFPDGRFVYRYDLSSLGAEATNLWAQVVGTNGVERVALAAGVTSVRGRLLREEYATVTDGDGDGITTYDEIFLYGTDPELPDSDGDGILDGEEIDGGTSPLVRDVTNAEILVRLAAGVTNETVEIVSGELASTKLWDGFVLDGDFGTTTLYTRTFTLDRQDGWTTCFISARGESWCADGADAIHEWSLDGVEILWSDNAGLSGTLVASPRNDSCHLPIAAGATRVTVTLRALSGGGRHASWQPLYLLTHTPKLKFPGSQGIAGDDGNTYNVFTDPTKLACKIDRASRPCRADLYADERTDDDYSMPSSPGVYSLPFGASAGGDAGVGRSALRGRSGSGGGRYLVILAPWVSYGSAHYVCTHDYPFDCDGFGWGCDCEPECGSGISDHSAVEASFESDGSSVVGSVAVGGVQVWSDEAYHVVWGCDHEDVETEPTDECPCGSGPDCPYCACCRVDGPSLGSIRFRISLGETSDGGIAGFAWFESDGPVTVNPWLFEVEPNPCSEVDVSWDGWDMYVTTYEVDGRDLLIAEAADGVAISVWRQGTLLETWDIVNVGGSESAVRFVKRDSEDVLLEDWTYSCVLEAGEWVWSKTDNLPASQGAHPPLLQVENGTNWVYSADGRLERLSVGTNDAETVLRTFSYDAAGRLTRVDDGTNGCVSIAYDAAGNIAAMTGPEGTLAAAWDANGVLTNLDTSAWNGNVPLAATALGARSGGGGGTMSPAEAVQHYLNGGGAAVTMPFGVVGTNWLKPTDFDAVKSLVASCREPGAYPVSGTKAVPATGSQKLYLGNVTVRLEGTVTYTGGCCWSFSGTMTGESDRYDFNAANRGFAGETLTFIGRLLFSGHGTPYPIHFSGFAPLSGSGHCGD